MKLKYMCIFFRSDYMFIFLIQGDSGSPLVCNKKLTGIVSFGPAKDCGKDNKHPGVYTNVGFFKKWIEKCTRKADWNLVSDYVLPIFT